MKELIYKNTKIVVVDDVEEVLNSTKNSLKFEGMNVETFNNPLEALEYLKSNAADVILLDFFMPQMNGDKFIEKLREFNNETVIILRTGYSDKVPPMEMIDSLNIQGYIDKLKGEDELLLMTKSAIKTAYLHKQTIEQQKQINSLQYRDEFFGKFLYRIVGETRERFMVISGLLNCITNKEERSKLSEEEITRYSGHIQNAMNKFMDCIRTLEIEKISTLNNGYLKELLKSLFEIHLQTVHANLEVEGEDHIAFDCEPKTLIYILVDIIEYLLNNNEKDIKLYIEKDEKVTIKILNVLINEDLFDKLTKLANFDAKIKIEIEKENKQLIIYIG